MKKLSNTGGFDKKKNSNGEPVPDNIQPQINPVVATIPRIIGANPIKRNTPISRGNNWKFQSIIQSGTA